MGKSQATPPERAYPEATESEACVVGSMLLKPDCTDDVQEIVRGDDFLDESSRLFAESIFRLRANGKAIDGHLVVAEMRTAGTFEQAGGTPTLSKMAEAVPNAAHAIYYAKLVREASERRALINRATGIVADAYDPLQPIDEQISRAEDSILSVRMGRRTSNTMTIGEAVTRAIDELENRGKGETSVSAKTGLSKLDAMFSGGLRRKELAVVAGRPSMGKTALALCFAVNAAIDNSKVLFVSLEMSATELSDRALSSMAQVPGVRMRSGTVSDHQRKAICEAAAKLSKTSMLIEDTTSVRVGDISAIARRSKKRLNGLDLLVIDYLQLIEPDDEHQKREEQVSRVTRRLKAASKELDCPVLCLAQLNREVEKTTDHKPRMSHLRESGAIEQDADIVLFVHRDDYYARNDEEKAKTAGKAELIISKQRNGPTGSVAVFWDATCGRFGNLAGDDIEHRSEPREPQSRFTEFDGYNTTDPDYEAFPK